jgi:SAM-dependent methyltransferase
VTSLAFPDGCFDLVFARYLLVHIPDLDKAISEIRRVLAPGGRIVSFEPDCCMDFTYPENAGMRTITRLFQQLFAQPHVGRQLVSRFRAANLNVLDAGALLGMEHKDQLYRRLYRATAEALGPAGQAKGVLAAEQFRELRSQMEALEVAPDHITVKLPDFWVIATR